MATFQELPEIKCSVNIFSRDSVSPGSIFGEVQTDLMVRVVDSYGCELERQVILHSFASVKMAVAICWGKFQGLSCPSFSRSIEVYVPPDLLQIGIIITHKKSITTLVWHHGYGEVTSEGNRASTLLTSTVCCPASRRLRSWSSALRIHVYQFAFCFSPFIQRHDIVLRTSHFTHRTSRIALMSHSTFTCHRSRCLPTSRSYLSLRTVARQTKSKTPDKHGTKRSLKCEIRT